MTSLTLEQGREALEGTHSYDRLPKLLDIAPLGQEGQMRDVTDWRTLLGEELSGCDNVGQYRKALKLCMFSGATPHVCPEMMTEEERAALAALPAVVTVYRGCGASNMIGCCWSLERETAVSFPFLHSYQQSEPLLVTGTVRRDRIVALKVNRGEQEVITFNARRVSIEPLSRADFKRVALAALVAPEKELP
jgi:hypothetical protein